METNTSRTVCREGDVIIRDATPKSAPTCCAPMQKRPCT